MNSKSALDNIKSDFFIPRIFVFMQKLITFKIVNYNKVLQKKLKISIKDFIESVTCNPLATDAHVRLVDLICKHYGIPFKGRSKVYEILE